MKNVSFRCELDNEDYYTSVDSTELLYFSPFANLIGVIESVDTDKEVSQDRFNTELDIGDVICVNGLEKNQIVINMKNADTQQLRLYNMRLFEANLHFFVKHIL